MAGVGCYGNAQVTVSRQLSFVFMATTDSWYSVPVRDLVVIVFNSEKQFQ